MPPTNSSTLRRATETDEPRTDWISVVSVVIRLSTSPVISPSKNPGLIPITRSKTALRMSATTRSPSRVTSQNRTAEPRANSPAMAMAAPK